MTKEKFIHGAGGGGGGGNRKTQPVVQQNVTQQVTVQAPVYTPTYTPDTPGLKSVSFAQTQFLICEGEIEGPLHGNTKEGLEKSVLLDQTPVRVGTVVSPQPSDLVFSWGRPPDQQSAVPGYYRISNTESVDIAVLEGFPVSRTVGSPSDEVDNYGKVLLTFQGLVRQTSKGDILPMSVEYRIDYTDATNTSRNVFNDTVSGKFSSQFQRSHEWKFEGTAPWVVRVTRVTANDQDRNNKNNQYLSAFSWTSVAVNLDQKLKYPHSSMLTVGLRADQYTQLPDVAIDLKGLKVQVPSNYNPETRVYTGTWDGTFKTAYTNNPAWVLYDIITKDRYGLGSYIETALVDKWTLYSIAQYCDQEVDASGGGKEPRFTCNLILQTSEEAWNVLQQLSSIFRGMLYYACGAIVAVQDREKAAVFTFNESNTLEDVSNDGKVSRGNFNYAGAAKRARHTVVLASWDDPNDNYQPRVEYIADEEGMARYGYRPTDLRLLGVTSRGQALRAANWTLLSEALLDDTVTFRSNEIGSAVRPGDIVKIADPNKAGVRYGGRIMNVSGNNVRLDAAPPTPAGGWAGATFTYMINGANNQPELVNRAISSVSSATVTLAAFAGTAPVAGNPWLIEVPSRVAQQFRITSVEEQGEGVYAYTGLRYRSDIYKAVDEGTDLTADQSFGFRFVKPGAPTITRGAVIFDNNTSKIEVAWTPAPTNNNLKASTYPPVITGCSGRPDDSKATAASLTASAGSRLTAKSTPKNRSR